MLEQKFSFSSNEKYDPEKNYTRHSLAHIKGGLHMNKQSDEKIREIFKSILKKIGKKILEGKLFDVMKISKPIQICYPLTFLETVANDYLYCPIYYKYAAEEKEPIQRLKFVITAHVAAYYKNGSIVKNKAPLDGMLGETLQGSKLDGTQIYVEQTCLDPPKMSYLLTGPKKSYILYGNGQLTAHLTGMNTLYGEKLGKTTVKFLDQTEIQITNPEMEVSGLIMGDRIQNYVKTVFFVDKANHLMAELTFNKKNTSRFSKITSAFSKLFRSNNPPEEQIISDTFQVSIFHYSKKDHPTEIAKQLLCEGSGSWLEYIEFDGIIYWKIDDPIEEWNLTGNNLLPSNGRDRIDLKYLINGDMINAEKEKNILEENCLQDEKLRSRNKKNKSNLNNKI